MMVCYVPNCSPARQRIATRGQPSNYPPKRGPLLSGYVVGTSYETDLAGPYHTLIRAGDLPFGYGPLTHSEPHMSAK